VQALAGGHQCIRTIQGDIFDGSQSPADVPGIATWQLPREPEHCLREVHGIDSLDGGCESSGQLAGATSNIEHRARRVTDQLSQQEYDAVGVGWPGGIRGGE
jgi:hypothetical protein